MCQTVIGIKNVFILLICFFAIFEHSHSKTTNGKDTESSIDPCVHDYGIPTFKNDSQLASMSPPPLLIAPSGLGIWIRSLIEHATGILSGSLDFVSTPANDNNLQTISKKLFRGESFCGLRMSAINTYSPSSVRLVVDRVWLDFNDRSNRKKCRAGVVRNIHRTIVITQNPFDMAIAILADSRSELSVESKSRKLFSALDATRKTWDILISPLLQYYSTKLFIVRYEDLMDPSQRLRVLGDIAFSATGEEVPLRRLECAFAATSHLAAQNMEISSTTSLSLSTFTMALPTFNQINQRMDRYLCTMNYSYSNSQASNFLHVEPTKVNATVCSGRNMRVGFCVRTYSRRRFAQEGPQRGDPPLLLSFPGSGNTWTRLLIEFSTGVYTGSVDLQDRDLQRDFRGEKFCNKKQAAIKVHPVNVFLNSSHKRPALGLTFDEQRRKCEQEGADMGAGMGGGFERVILLVRDPYPAIFSEYQRAQTKKHTGTLSVDNFDVLDWVEAATKAAKDYEASWTRKLAPMLKKFPPTNVLVIKYEDLTLDDETKYGTLERMAEFANQGLMGMGKMALAERVRCAFALSESPRVHRIKPEGAVNASYAYAAARDHGLVEAMWPLLRPFAQRMGYSQHTTPPM